MTEKEMRNSKKLKDIHAVAYAKVLDATVAVYKLLEATGNGASRAQVVGNICLMSSQILQDITKIEEK